MRFGAGASLSFGAGGRGEYVTALCRRDHVQTQAESCTIVRHSSQDVDMKEWTLSQARNRFSEVVEAAKAGEPQFVTRRGKGEEKTGGCTCAKAQVFASSLVLGGWCHSSF